jgi:hypothetical protein
MTSSLADALPPRVALPAAGMPVPSYQTLYRRGQLTDPFFGPPTGRALRYLTRRGTLALAAYRAMTERGVEIAELAPADFLRWVDFWHKTRGTTGAVRELVIRYYGRPGEPDSKTSILPNTNLLATPPAPGARLTIIFDLDEICGATERAIAALSAGPVEVYAPDDGGS